MRAIPLLLLVLSLFACAPASMPGPDFDALWNHGDPAGTERAFRALLDEHPDAGADWRAELQTQVARSVGLQQRFDEALALLDALALDQASERVRVRALLERGRVMNTRGDAADALPVFEEAFELANQAGEEGLAVDAAHMVAIAAPEPDAAMLWNLNALALAETSGEPDARRWRGSLHNNLGWTHHGAGRFDLALRSFQASAVVFEADGKPDRARIARWAVARTLRSLERYAEALAAQEQLLGELEQLGEADGYVFEELAENLLALDRADEAAPMFLRAHELLREDAQLARAEPERLERLERLGSPE